jgi:transcription elongation factor Elf1
MKGYNTINNVLRTDPNPYGFFNIYKKHIIRYLPDINKIDINNEVQNSLNKVWIYMFCLTFHYYDENEKQFRFEELIKFLPRVIDEKRELNSIMLSTMNKYGDENMIIKIFESFNNITYTEYCSFCSKFKGNWNQKQEKKNLDTTNTNLNISYYKDKNTVNGDEENNSLNKIVIKESDTKSIRKKIFILKKGVYKKKIEFELNYKCPFCGELNGTTNLGINLINKKKSGLMLCIKCNKYLEPKTNVVSGNDKLEFTIFSPIKLLNIAREISKDYGEKIELEELMEKYSSFYWSCIFYFYLNGFNYEILMVYKTKEMKTSSKPKKKVLKFKNLKLDKQYK